MTSIEQYLKERARARTIKEWFTGESGREGVAVGKPELLCFAQQDVLSALDKNAVVVQALNASQGTAHGSRLARDTQPVHPALSESPSGTQASAPDAALSAAAHGSGNACVLRPASPQRLHAATSTTPAALDTSKDVGPSSTLPSPATTAASPTATITRMAHSASQAGHATTAPGDASANTPATSSSMGANSGGHVNSGAKVGPGATRPASAPATSRERSEVHWQMSEKEWQALPMEYWARHGPSRDESQVQAHAATVTSYDIHPEWDPVSNVIKRTAKPDTFELDEDEAARREHEFSIAAASHLVQAKQLLADAEADTAAMNNAAAAAAEQQLRSRRASSGSPLRSRPSSRKPSDDGGDGSKYSLSPRSSKKAPKTRRPVSAPASSITRPPAPDTATATATAAPGTGIYTSASTPRTHASSGSSGSGCGANPCTENGSSSVAGSGAARVASAGSSSGSRPLSPRSSDRPTSASTSGGQWSGSGCSGDAHARPQLSSRHGSAHHKAALAAVIWEEGGGDGDAEEEILAVDDIGGDELADDRDVTLAPHTRARATAQPSTAHPHQPTTNPAAAHPFLSVAVQQCASVTGGPARVGSAGSSRPQSASYGQAHATTTIVPAPPRGIHTALAPGGPDSISCAPAAHCVNTSQPAGTHAAHAPAPAAPTRHSPAQQHSGSPHAPPPRTMSAPFQKPPSLPPPAWLPRRAVASAMPHTRTGPCTGPDVNVWGAQGPPSLSRYPSSSGFPDLQSLGHIAHRYFNSQVGQAPEPDQDPGTQSDQEQHGRHSHEHSPPHVHAGSAPRPRPASAGPMPFQPNIRTRPPTATRVGRPLSAQLSGQEEVVASRLHQPTTAFLGKVATATTAPSRPASAYAALGRPGNSHVAAAATATGGRAAGTTPSGSAFAKPTYISPYAHTSTALVTGLTAQRARPQSAAAVTRSLTASPVGHTSHKTVFSPTAPYGTPGQQWASTSGHYSKPGPKRAQATFDGQPLPQAGSTRHKGKQQNASAAGGRILKEVVVTMLPQEGRGSGQLPAPFVMPPSMMHTMLDTYKRMQ